MSARYYIDAGQTVTEPMPLDWDGALVSFLFFDAQGGPAVVVGMPMVYRSLYESGDIFKEVQPFASGEWRFNGPAARVKIDLAGVTGYTSYRVIVWRTDDPLPTTPEGAYGGSRAATTQSYSEVNKKAGAQWEASTRVQLAGGTGVLETVFITGSQPVDLKERIIGFDGVGAVGRIYRGPTYTGGTAAQFSNMKTSKALEQPAAQLISGATVTDRGVEIAAAIFPFGSASAQGRGDPPSAYASNRIFDEPNTTYLFVIETLDSQTQFISSRLELYEGPLDLPLLAQ
jgi:hypothetical protein